MIKLDLNYLKDRSPFNNGLYIGGSVAVVNKYSAIEVPVKIFSGINAPYLKFLGAMTYSWSHLSVNVKSIGRYCSIAAGVQFGPADHPLDWMTTSNCSWDPKFWSTSNHPDLCDWKPYVDPRHLNPREAFITIGNDVWIGHGAIIKQGLVIGDGAVIGAGAVVTKDVEPYSVVAGVPAKVIKMRFSPSIVDLLMKIRWWEFGIDAIKNIQFDAHPEVFCNDLAQLEVKGFSRVGPQIQTVDNFDPFVIDDDFRKLCS